MSVRGADAPQAPISTDMLDARCALLAGLPLFGGFGVPELREIAGLFTERVHAKGESVCREGEPGDAFFVVLSGELEVWTAGPPPRLLNRLHPGDTFGEISLLLGGPRSASVTATRGTRLLTLAKPDFDRLVSQSSRALEHLVRALCKRLSALSRGETDARAVLMVSVVGPAASERRLVASALATMLPRLRKQSCLLLSLANGAAHDGARSLSALASASPEEIGKASHRVRDDLSQLSLTVDSGMSAKRCVEALDALGVKVGAEHPLLVLEVLSEQGDVLAGAREAADVVVEIVRRAEPGAPERAPGGPRTFQVLPLPRGRSSPIPIHACEPFVIPHDRELASFDLVALAEALHRDPFRPAAVPLHRLARKIVGASVGVALGGGAAFGIAHIGVLQVLEANGIPVDLAAGTSFGSIVAIGYAAGLRPAEMAEIANRIGTKRTTVSALDFTLTRPGFLAGDRLIRIFSPLIGDVETFEQLRLPCRTVAADIETGERISLREGRLDAAFRASCSVPMLWSPVRHQGRVLVDGGIVDPVPAEVAFEMGADVCFAVNVVPPPRKGVENVLTRLYRQASWLNPLSYLGLGNGLPSLFDVILNSIQALEHELGQFKALSADVRINPDLSDLTWIEFYRPAELIARGAEAAERALPEIRRVLAERLATGAAAPTSAR